MVAFAPILATKLYIPPVPKISLRSRRIKRLDEGLSERRKLSLISAPAGFGKPTLVIAPSCIDIIAAIIKVTIDKIIQRVASKF